jgi:hypothetical protein
MKLKKSTKKIILITLIILVTVGASALFYFLFIRQDQEKTWFDSNWSYRRSIYITNISKEYQNTQQDILIEIDTETLISEGKLSFDCKDIRFVDSDNQNPLPYWIEGGCNTKETQVWIRKFLSKEQEQFVFLYYGNKLAVDNQEFWDGEFLSISTNKCEEDWSINKDFNGRFILGDTEYGKTGGENSHTHTISNSNEDCKSEAYVINSIESNSCDINKDNILDSKLGSVTNIPDYKNINVCESKNGYITSQYLTVLSENATQDGWSHLSLLDDKYPRGDDQSNPSILLSHSHDLKCVNKSLEIKDGTKQYISLNNKFKTKPIEEYFPYLIINFISTQEDRSINNGDIMMFTQLPPLGWTLFSDLDGKFIKGSESNFLYTNESNSHNHIFDLDVSIKNTTDELLSTLDSSLVCLDANNQELTTSYDYMLPPYITVIFGQKKSSLITALSINIGDEERGEVLGTFGSGPSVPTDLKTEGETNPTDLTTSTPGFTAVFNHPDYP